MNKVTLYCLLIGFSSFVFSHPAFGQNEKLISGEFSQVRFDRFVEKITEDSNYQFYYIPSELDSFYVTISAKEFSMPALLAKVFTNTPFHFAIDTLNHVFITRRIIIQTSLAPGFFNKSTVEKDTVIKEEPVIYTATRFKQRIKAPVENKLIEIGSRSNNRANSKSTVVGYVRDIKNGEPVIGASIFIDSLAVGVVTDQFGYYSFTLPVGRHRLEVYSVGMKNIQLNIILYSDGKLNIDMDDNVVTLKEVVVSAERRTNVRSLQMGVNLINIKTIKQVPVVFGEADILKVVTTLPGVTTVGEGSSGFNVRGGSTDQNLILFNDATIYNSSHLFGFFSVFNPDIVKGVELFKSAIPEKYGGRLSSVLEVTSKEGNNKKLSGTGGIGPLTGRLTLEGPIVKDRTSFIVSVRSTYSDWLLRNIKTTDYKNSSAGFSDAAFHINHTINSNNSIYVNGYWSNDRFSLNKDTVYKYSNRNFNVKWKHNFTNQFYGVFLGGMDHYQYSLSGSPNPFNAYKLSFSVDQANFRADFTYAKNNKHAFNFGLGSIYYKLHPGEYQPSGSQSLVIPNVVPDEQGLESAIYFADQFNISPTLSINAGLRYSVFNYLGPHNQYVYLSGIPKDKSTITDTLMYSRGKIIKTYGGPELRLALRYRFAENSSIKVSYNTLRQYIHLLSNTTAISPTDVWKLSDPNIEPQEGAQVSLGYYQDFNSNKIETSIEVYYKSLKNYLDYKSGATIVMNPHIETDVIKSKGKAYGAELMFKKLSGKLNGWISYTYSRTFLKTDDPVAGDPINDGNFYPANYDKPHSANLIANYKFSHRLSVSFNLIYSTGRPITLPIAIYNLGGAQRVYYSYRNEYRIPDYFRADLSVNIEGNHRIKQLTHNSWSFGVYNLTAHKNPYSVYFTQENGVIKGYKLSIFGTVIPFVTYNFRF